MMSSILPVYVLCFVAIKVCDARHAVTKLNDFYATVTTLSLALDPRDYIVPPTRDQTNQYHDLNQGELMMISEINIFFYKDMLTAPVELSLSFSREPMYQLTFIIEAERASKRINNGKVDKSTNYVRKDGKMMRFYACFLGKLCHMNPVDLPYPMNKFKIEGDDSHSLLRIFIKSFILNVEKRGFPYPERVYSTTYHTDLQHNPEREKTCSVQFRDDLKIDFNRPFIYEDSSKSTLRYASPKNMKLSILSLRFALFIIIKNNDNVNQVAYKLLTAADLPGDWEKDLQINFWGFYKILCYKQQ